MSPHVASLSKVLLVTERTPALREAPMETKIRRYRLARLHVNGLESRELLSGLKRAYD